MASNRARAKRTLTNKITDINSRVAQNEKSTKHHITTNSVSSDSLAPEAVKTEALGNSSVTAEKIPRGAIGTEHLGIINKISSDSHLILDVPDGAHVMLNGDGYSAPIAGVKYSLALDENRMVVTQSMPRLGIIDPDYTYGLPKVTFDGDSVVSSVGYPWLPPYTPLPGDHVVLWPVGDSWSIGGVQTQNIAFPMQRTLSLSAGWSAYPNWAVPSYSKSSDGIVVLSGLAQGGTTTSGTVIATLPAGFRPDYDTVFGINNTDTSKVVTVRADGTIELGPNISATWLSLSGVKFPAAGVAEWDTVPSFLNGWVDFGVANPSYGSARYWKDADGMVWLQGAVSGGTTTDLTPMLNLPTGYRSDKISIVVTSSSNAFGYLDVDSGGDIRYRSGNAGNTSVHLNSVFASSGNTLTWTAPTLLNSWTNYNTGTHTSARYSKSTNGLVHVQGLVAGGTVSNVAIFNLPTGSQPAHGAVSGVLFHSVSNNTRGRMEAYNATAATQGSNAWFSLDGVVWLAEN